MDLLRFPQDDVTFVHSADRLPRRRDGDGRSIRLCCACALYGNISIRATGSPRRFCTMHNEGDESVREAALAIWKPRVSGVSSNASTNRPHRVLTPDEEHSVPDAPCIWEANLCGKYAYVIHHDDAIRGMRRSIADGAIDLVIADPPRWGTEQPFAAEWAAECVRVLRPGGALLVFTGPMQGRACAHAHTLVDRLLLHLVDVCGLEFHVSLVNAFRTGAFGSKAKYLLRTETIWYLSKPGGARTLNNVDDSVLRVERLNTRSPVRKLTSVSLFWMRSEELVRRLVEAHSHEGDLVASPFMGSGVEQVICAQTHRNHIGFETIDAAISTTLTRMSAAGLRHTRRWHPAPES